MVSNRSVPKSPISKVTLPGWASTSAGPATACGTGVGASTATGTGVGCWFPGVSAGCVSGYAALPQATASTSSRAETGNTIRPSRDFPVSGLFMVSLLSDVGTTKYRNPTDYCGAVSTLTLEVTREGEALFPPQRQLKQILK